jgi:hypothetical protein
LAAWVSISGAAGAGWRVGMADTRSRSGLVVILLLLMGLLTSVQLSLFTLLYTLVVLIALQGWVEPRLFKRR